MHGSAAGLIEECGGRMPKLAARIKKIDGKARHFSYGVFIQQLPDSLYAGAEERVRRAGNTQAQFMTEFDDLL